jgi:hypothetical protein
MSATDNRLSPLSPRGRHNEITAITDDDGRDIIPWTIRDVVAPLVCRLVGHDPDPAALYRRIGWNGDERSRTDVVACTRCGTVLSLG